MASRAIILVAVIGTAKCPAIIFMVSVSSFLSASSALTNPVTIACMIECSNSLTIATIGPSDCMIDCSAGPGFHESEPHGEVIGDSPGASDCSGAADPAFGLFPFPPFLPDFLAM